ncbi:MAG: 50S ribosomal protein L24 [Flavobacteriales bacterium]|nr:50S ribosomal protein L24 [Flavobacteriales bacterium]
MKLHIKKGDQVVVISGDNKGKEGKVLSVDIVKGRALVEGVNLISKHTKPNAANPDGGIVKVEGSIHLSNLMVIDGKGDATRVYREKDKDGKSMRMSKKNKEVIK